MDNTQISVGDMKVVYIKNSDITEHPMTSVDDARAFIKTNAEKDLRDPAVDVNSFSLLVYDPSHDDAYRDDEGYGGWYEWRDENDIDINGYPVYV